MDRGASLWRSKSENEIEIKEVRDEEVEINIHCKALL